MKKTLLTIMIGLLCCGAVGAQSHMKFKGIVMDGTLRSFTQKLEQQGLKYIGTQDNVAMLEGEFAATKGCTIVVSRFSDRDQVNVVGVIFPEAETWNSLTTTYYNLKEMLTEKYGRPESIERFTEREPTSEFLKFHAVLDDQCQYLTEFTIDNGKIQLTLIKSDYDKACVALRYIDNANAQETRKKIMDDL